MDARQQFAALVERQKGVVTRDQAIRHGISARMVSHNASHQIWQPLYPAVFLATYTPPTFEQRVIGAALWMPDAVFSHRTAARLWNWDSADDDLVEIIAARRIRNRGEFAVVHRTRRMPRDVRTVRGLRVTGPVRTLVDLCGVVGERRLLHAYECAYRRDPLIQLTLQRVLKIVRNGRRELDYLHELSTRRYQPPPTESALEADVDDALCRAGLFAERQVKIYDAKGRRIGRVDLFFREARYVIEVDGALHATREMKNKDDQRDLRLKLAGYEVLRIDSRMFETNRLLVSEIADVVDARRRLISPRSVDPRPLRQTAFTF